VVLEFGLRSPNDIVRQADHLTEAFLVQWDRSVCEFLRTQAGSRLVAAAAGVRGCQCGCGPTMFGGRKGLSRFRAGQGPRRGSTFSKLTIHHGATKSADNDNRYVASGMRYAWFMHYAFVTRAAAFLCDLP
jgi:hypothetical protein